MHWACPACGREFGRTRQSHVCAPAMTLEQYFETRPAYEREVFEAVKAHLETVGPVYIEPVGVGILIKKSRTIIELRPRQRWVAVSFVLDRLVEHPRITRTIRAGLRHYHAVRATAAADIDETVSAWLTESYHSTS